MVGSILQNGTELRTNLQNEMLLNHTTSIIMLKHGYVTAVTVDQESAIQYLW